MENVERPYNGTEYWERGAKIVWIGFLPGIVYMIYLWGMTHDFGNAYFFGYLVAMPLLLLLPRGLALAFFMKDHVFTVLEQILFVIGNLTLVYFIAPVVIKFSYEWDYFLSAVSVACWVLVGLLKKILSYKS